MVWDPRTEKYEEPSAAERERALGYETNDTAAAGVTERQRREVLGKCIDANVLQSIMAIAAAWHRLLCWRAGKEQVVVTVSEEDCRWEAPQDGAVHCCLAASCRIQEELLDPSLEQHLVSTAMAAVAESEERGSLDIWADAQVLRFLRTIAV
jgi:hypothetical protein